MIGMTGVVRKSRMDKKKVAALGFTGLLVFSVLLVLVLYISKTDDAGLKRKNKKNKGKDKEDKGGVVEESHSEGTKKLLTSKASLLTLVNNGEVKGKELKDLSVETVKTASKLEDAHVQKLCKALPKAKADGLKKLVEDIKLLSQSRAVLESLKDGTNVPSVTDMETLWKAQEVSGGFAELGLEVPDNVQQSLLAAKPYKELMRVLGTSPDLGQVTGPARAQFEELESDEEKAKLLPPQVQAAFRKLKAQMGLKAQAERIVGKEEVCEDVPTLEGLCAVDLGLTEEQVTALKDLLPPKPVVTVPVKDENGVTVEEGSASAAEVPSETTENAADVEERVIVVLDTEGEKDLNNTADVPPDPFEDASIKTNAAVIAEFKSKALSKEKMNKLLDAHMKATGYFIDRVQYVDSTCFVLIKEDYSRLERELIGAFETNGNPVTLAKAVNELIDGHLAMVQRLSAFMTEKLEPVDKNAIIQAVLYPSGILSHLFLPGYNIKRAHKIFKFVTRMYMKRMANLVERLEEEEESLLHAWNALEYLKEVYLPALSLSHVLKEAFPGIENVEESDLEDKTLHLAPNYLQCCFKYSAGNHKCRSLYDAIILFYDFLSLDSKTKRFGKYGRNRMLGAHFIGELELALQPKAPIQTVVYKNGQLFQQQPILAKIIGSFLATKGPRSSYTAELMNNIEAYPTMMEKRIQGNPFTTGACAEGLQEEMNLINVISDSILSYDSLKKALEKNLTVKKTFQGVATLESVSAFTTAANLDMEKLALLKDYLQSYGSFLDLVFPNTDNKDEYHLENILQLSKCEEKRIRMELLDAKKPVLNERVDALFGVIGKYPTKRDLFRIYNRQKKNATALRYFELVVQLYTAMYNGVFTECLKQKANPALDVKVITAKRNLREAELFLAKFKTKLYPIEDMLPKVLRELKDGGCSFIDERDSSRALDISACFIYAGGVASEKHALWQHALTALGLYMLRKDSQNLSMLQAIQDAWATQDRHSEELFNEILTNANGQFEDGFVEIMFKLEFLNACKIEKRLKANVVTVEKVVPVVPVVPAVPEAPVVPDNTDSPVAPVVPGSPVVPDTTDPPVTTTVAPVVPVTPAVPANATVAPVTTDPPVTTNPPVTEGSGNEAPATTTTTSTTPVAEGAVGAEGAPPAVANETPGVPEPATTTVTTTEYKLITNTKIMQKYASVEALNKLMQKAIEEVEAFMQACEMSDYANLSKLSDDQRAADPLAKLEGMMAGAHMINNERMPVYYKTLLKEAE